jgi:formate dehydrogenase subunit gamma
MRISIHFIATLILGIASLTASAGVPDRNAPSPYPEERTIQQVEQSGTQPGLGDSASGKQHLDRHYLGPYGEPERDVLLQRGGNTWRQLRNEDLALGCGMLLLVMLLTIVGFYMLIGPMRLEHPPSGRTLQRFSVWQRTVHWSTAISFLVLAFSGLLLLFGKKIILPWLGHAAFADLAMFSKALHNFVGPLFIFCSLAIFVTFVHRNFFIHADLEWIKHFGGLVSKRHIPAGYFNAGEKLWFWGAVTMLGLLMSSTGLVMDFVVLDQTRYQLQIADVLHIAGASLYMAGAMAHIYIGTIGLPGAYRAMRDGVIDSEWAGEHHSLWYEQLLATQDESDAMAPVHMPPMPGPIR